MKRGLAGSAVMCLSVAIAVLAVVAPRAAAQDVDAEAVVATVLSYEYGGDGEAVDQLTARMRASQGDRRKAYEAAMVKVLEDADASFAARDLACRQLRLIGSDDSVELLAGLLAEAKLSHPARLALQDIPGERAAAALRDAAASLEGDLRIGVISSIGRRRDGKAVDLLAGIAREQDPVTARAALNALSDIASPEAAHAVLTLGRNDMPVAQRQALLRIAEAISAAGRSELAGKYFALMGEAWRDDPPHMQAAVLSGYIRAAGAKAAPTDTDELAKLDATVQAAVLDALVALDEAEATGRLVALAEAGSAPLRAKVIAALGRRGDRAALPVLAAAVDDDDATVKLAAISAIEKLGDEDQVPTLLRIAVESDDPVRQASRQGLARLTGGKVNEALTDLLSQASAPTQVEAIAALQARQAAESVPAIHALAETTSASEAVRVAAAMALGDLGGEPQLAALIGLMKEAGQPRLAAAATRAASSICRRVGDSDQVVALLREAVADTGDEATRVRLIQMLPMAGGPALMQVAHAACRAGGDPVRDAAIRAMAAWPDVEALPPLLSLARSAESRTHRILALRGAIRLLGVGGVEPAKRLAGYETALTLASRADEKRLILGGLAEVNDEAALILISKQIEDGSVRNDAAAALVTWCRKLEPERIESALDSLRSAREAGVAEAIGKQIDQRIAELEAFVSCIRSWQVAGPYQREGVRDQALLGATFAPEMAEPAEQVNWQPIETLRSQPWLVDLQRALKAEQAVAYLRCYVTASQAMDARLELGSDDGVKVWLNGKVVHTNNTNRGVEVGDDRVDVGLKAGRNTLLVKVSQGGGGWGLTLRVCDRQGHPIPGLKFSPTP